MATFWSIVGILLSGLAGGYAGWWLMTVLGLESVAGALVAAVTGMVVATAAWVGITVLLRAMRLVR